MLGVLIPSLLASFPKEAIFWKGDLLKANASAAASVRARGFKFAVTASVPGAAMLSEMGLHPILLLADQSFAPRIASPFSNSSGYDQRIAALRSVLRNTSAAISGVGEDIEEHPFPHAAYKADGQVDEYHSRNFSDLPERIGLKPASSTSWHPPFVDFPAPGSHPLATMEQIEYNFPAMASPPAPPATGIMAVPSSDVEGVAIPFGAPSSGRVTRIDLPLWRVSLSRALGLPSPSPALPQEALDYFIVAATDAGAPDTSGAIMCAGCQVQPQETKLLKPGGTASISLKLYLDPEDASLGAGLVYFLVLRWSAGSVPPGDQSYAVGTADAADAADVDSTLWHLSPGGVWSRDTRSRSVPAIVFSPDPPSGFGLNQIHSDWIAFQCSVNARYISAYKAAAVAGQQVIVYSGYAGQRYRPTAHNYPTDAASAYSVDWSRLAAAGLTMAVAGYGSVNVSATRAALDARSALVCGVRETGSQARFAERYELCDGAMEWFPGSIDADPGYHVP
jgi:hypothetical protein